MKWVLGVGVAIASIPLLFLTFFAPGEQTLAQCAENAVASAPTVTVSTAQLDYARSVADASPRSLSTAEAGVVLTLAAHATDMRTGASVNPMTGEAPAVSLTVAIGDVLADLDVLTTWDTRPPSTTAALLLEEDPAELAEAWDLAYAVLDALDPASAAVLDAVTRTGSACGTALGVAIDPGQLAMHDGFTSPLPGASISSGFGYRIHPIYGYRKLHAGTDFSYGAGQSCNRPIVAAGEGDVVFAGAAAGYGHVIMINHDNGVQTRYAHMYATGVLAQVGDHVQAGDIIGLVGSDGASTGCHLHFETYLPTGQVIDATALMPWLAGA